MKRHIWTITFILFLLLLSQVSAFLILFLWQKLADEKISKIFLIVLMSLTTITFLIYIIYKKIKSNFSNQLKNMDLNRKEIAKQYINLYEKNNDAYELYLFSIKKLNLFNLFLVSINILFATIVTLIFNFI